MGYCMMIGGNELVIVWQMEVICYWLLCDGWR